MEVDLSLPEDITDLDRVATLAIRAYYQQQLGVYYAMRADGREPWLPGRYDRPPTPEHQKARWAVWYGMLLAARRASYNPLWGVDWVVGRAMVQNVPPNPYTLVNDANTPTIVAHGLGMCQDAATRVRQSVGVLLTYVMPQMLLHRLTAESALNGLSLEVGLDPVIELLWRDSRKIKSPVSLRTRARLAYACCPSVYGHPTFPESFLKVRKLTRLFEVPYEPMVATTAVNELLVP